MRVGVQEVLFVSLVQVGQMLVAAAAMLWYDWMLFLMVLGLAPVMWLINRHFHRRLSDALRRDARIVQPRDGDAGRVGASASASRRASCGRMRTPRMFHDLATDHSQLQHDRAAARTGCSCRCWNSTARCSSRCCWWSAATACCCSRSTTDVGDLVGFFFMANMFFSPIRCWATSTTRR